MQDVGVFAMDMHEFQCPVANQKLTYDVQH